MTRGRARVAYLQDDLRNLSSFGEDANGELYAVTTTGRLYELR